MMKNHTARADEIIPVVVFLIFFSIFFSIAGMAAAQPKVRMENKTTEVPFSYLEETFMVVPVRINGSVNENFILDTAIGVNLISESVCRQLQCKIESEHSGKRMSGQEIRILMSHVAALSFGGHELENVPVGVFDPEALMPGAKIGGFLSLGFFRDLPYSVDYVKSTITLEDSATLEKIRAEGTRVPIRLDIQGPSLDIFMPLVLPGGRQISVEVDTGSQILILNEECMKALGVAPIQSSKFQSFFNVAAAVERVPGLAPRSNSATLLRLSKPFPAGTIPVVTIQEICATFPAAIQKRSWYTIIWKTKLCRCTRTAGCRNRANRSRFPDPRFSTSNIGKDFVPH